MNKEDYEFFKENGYLVLGKILNAAELTRCLDLFDRNRCEEAHLWRYLGRDTHQTANTDCLQTWREVDEIVRHRKILPIVAELMGESLSLLEVSARHMDQHPDVVKIAQQWHRDVGHLEEHPLRLNYIQAMLYLTDVNEETHCFTISPEPADGPILERDEQLAKGGVEYLYGPAGTVILFNASTLHTATVRTTVCERKTVQTYYCHRDKTLGNLDMVIPAQLWRDHPDPAARAFYSPQSKAPPTHYRELRSTHIAIDLLADSHISHAQNRCPWNEADDTDEHRCIATNHSICQHFRGIRRPDIVQCGYPA